jgi:hypothetical protein
MNTLCFLVALLTIKPQKADGTHDICSAPSKGQPQPKDIALIPFTTPDHQLRLFAPRNPRFE